MSHFNPLEGSFDDLEELMDESASLAAVPKAAKGKAPTPDLDDLDALLEESTVLASAKRAKAQGRKLTAEQSALLEVNRLAAEAELWVTQHYYAHVSVTECACGERAQDLSGWYAYQVQRNSRNRRLLRVKDTELPEYGYQRSRVVTMHKAKFCPVCIAALPLPLAGACDLLETLGGC
jgi:hypothetical protein